MYKNVWSYFFLHLKFHEVKKILLGLSFEIFSRTHGVLVNSHLIQRPQCLVWEGGLGKRYRNDAQKALSLCLCPTFRAFALRSDIKVAGEPQQCQKHRYWLQRGSTVFISVELQVCQSLSLSCIMSAGWDLSGQQRYKTECLSSRSLSTILGIIERKSCSKQLWFVVLLGKLNTAWNTLKCGYAK